MGWTDRIKGGAIGAGIGSVFGGSAGSIYSGVKGAMPNAGKAEYMPAAKFSYEGQYKVGEARDREQANLDRLNQWAQGKGDPSAAQLQMNRGLEASQAQAAAAGRGQVGGNSAALGQRNAANMQSSLSGAAATDAGMLRAAEQQASQQQYTQAAGQFRKQAADEQTGAMRAQVDNNAANAQLRDSNAQRSADLLGKGMGAVGSVFGAVGANSDARVKEKISKGLPISADDQARYAKSEQGAGRDATKVQNEIRGYLKALSHGEPDVYGRELMNQRAQQDQLALSKRPAPPAQVQPPGRGDPYARGPEHRNPTAPGSFSQGYGAGRPQTTQQQDQGRNYGTAHLTRPAEYSPSGNRITDARGQQPVMDMSGKVLGHGPEKMLTPQGGAVPLNQALREGGVRPGETGGGLAGYQKRIDDIRARDLDRADGSWDPEGPGEVAAQEFAKKGYIETGVLVPGTGFDPASDESVARARRLKDLKDRMDAGPGAFDVIGAASHGATGAGGASPYETRKASQEAAYNAELARPATGSNEAMGKGKDDGRKAVGDAAKEIGKPAEKREKLKINESTVKAERPKPPPESAPSGAGGAAKAALAKRADQEKTKQAAAITGDGKSGHTPDSVMTGVDPLTKKRRKGVR